MATTKKPEPVAQTTTPELPPAQNETALATAKGFAETITKDASAYLLKMLGSEQGQIAAARVSMAFSAAARAAKDPTAFYRCSRASIASCIANSALHNLMPGGQLATVWLVPKGGELQWWLSHRGMAVLALRAGYQIVPVPVHKDDEYTVEFGEVTKHSPKGVEPATLDELAGCYLTIRRLSDGVSLGRPWVSVSVIERRRKAGGPVWNTWPIEMALKTTIRYAMSRGLVPIESTSLLSAIESEPEAIDIEPVVVSRPSERGGVAGLRIALEEVPEDASGSRQEAPGATQGASADGSHVPPVEGLAALFPREPGEEG